MKHMVMLDMMRWLSRFCMRVAKWFIVTVAVFYALLAIPCIFIKIELPYGYFLSPTYFEGPEWHHWFYNKGNMHLTNSEGDVIIPRPVIYVGWHGDYVFGDGFTFPGGGNTHYFILSKTGEKWEFFTYSEYMQKREELVIPTDAHDDTVWGMFQKRYTYSPIDVFILRLFGVERPKKVFPGLSSPSYANG